MTTLELQDLNDMVYFKLTRAFSRGLVSFGQLMRGIRLYNRNLETTWCMRCQKRKPIEEVFGRVCSRCEETGE